MKIQFKCQSVDPQEEDRIVFDDYDFQNNIEVTVYENGNEATCVISKSQLMEVAKRFEP